MKRIVFLLLMLVLINGCTKYHPIDVSINDETTYRSKVEVDVNKTKVDITITEKPREFIWYEVDYELERGNIIQVVCWDEWTTDRITLNISKFHTEETRYDEKMYDDNTLVKYISAGGYWNEELIDIDRINITDQRDCEVKLTFRFKQNRYTDGVLIETRQIFCNERDVLGSGNKLLIYNGEVLTTIEIKRFLDFPNELIVDECLFGHLY